MAAPLNPVHAEIHPPVLPEVAAVAAEMLALRHDLHAHPELAYEEHRTGDIVAARLAEWGYEVHRGLGDTGVVGTLRCGEHAHGKHIGKRLGLRADMDALPIRETTGLPYASRHDGKMHACGHDGHTATLLAAARVLAGRKNQLQGTLHLIFQPAEEGHGGAQKMVEQGLFEPPGRLTGTALGAGNTSWLCTARPPGRLSR